MKTYEYSGPDFDIVRAHPWTVAKANSGNRYWDLKERPELIRSSLEDFLPWSAWPGVETFYRLLEWLNGADSTLESNDCAFVGPRTNSTSQFTKGLEATGRLMILCRQLAFNLSKGHTERLKEALHHYLSQTDPELVFAAVGITVCQVQYVTLPLPEAQQRGVQLMLSFWAWGDTDEEVMGNLDRTFQNIWAALRAVEREVRASLISQVPGA